MDASIRKTLKKDNFLYIFIVMIYCNMCTDFMAIGQIRSHDLTEAQVCKV